MAQRARWTSKYEKGLVEVLTEYNLSHYRGQNGWCSEGWNRIVKDINTLFPEASFTKSQIQDKEAQLKKDYKAIKSIVRRSGISWNPTACIINTTAEKWDEIIEEDPKLRRYENKNFPLFEALDHLYEGQLAQGKHCFTSSLPTQSREERERTLNTSSDTGRKNKRQSSASRKQLRDERESTIDPPPKMTTTESQRIDNYTIEVEDEEQNTMCEVERRRAMYEQDSMYEDDDEEHANSRNRIGRGQGARPKKQKGSTSAPRIEDSMLAYVELKREQYSRMKDQALQQGQQYSICKCLEVLNAMVDLSDEIKVLASDVFKDSMNRELFLCYDSRLRGLWLKKEVAKLGTHLPPSSSDLSSTPSNPTQRDPKIQRLMDDCPSFDLGL